MINLSPDVLLEMLQKYNISLQLEQAAKGDIYPLLEKLMNETGIGYDIIMGIDQYKKREAEGLIDFIADGI